MKMSLISLVAIASSLCALPAFSDDATQIAPDTIQSEAPEFSDVLSAQDTTDDIPTPVAPGANNDENGLKKGPCSKIKLTAAEKAQIKTAAFASIKEKINLKAALQEAVLNYVELLGTPSTTAAQANAASAAINVAKSNLSTNRSGLKNDILFSILTPEQRKPALACERMMKRRHFRKRHEHGQRPKGGAQDQEVSN